MQFEFATTSRIIFGPGKIATLGTLAAEFGSQALIISGAPPGITARIDSLLADNSFISSTARVPREPTVDEVRRIIDLARQAPPDVIVGIGGGSAVDTSKAIASLLQNPGDVTEYLEIIGSGKPILNPSRPLIAIPTTAGTGSEATRNAVIGSPQHHVKVSLRSPFLLPRIAIIDTELTLGVPQDITAFTGMDALTQLIEPYTCNTPNPVTDSLCLEGIRQVAHSLIQAYDHGEDINAREGMSLAALFSGMALANARLGAVHGFAGVIGGETSAHHGAICASLLPNVMAVNIQSLRIHYPDHPALKRYAVIAQTLCGDQSASPESGVDWVRSFCNHANIPRLSKLGLAVDQFEFVIEDSVKASSMKGNPVTLSEAELRSILQASY